MQLLIRPTPFSDESLESYLLRLSDANFFESYQELSEALWQWLYEHDHEAAGAFPKELHLVNVYHAHQTSSFRVRALALVEKLAGLETSTLTQLALMHFAIRFSGKAAVFRSDIDIPCSFLRVAGIPICTQCIKEQAYIRQFWHLKHYNACHIHNCDLLKTCPNCNVKINYMISEKILHCECGFDFSEAPLSDARRETINLSRFVVGQQVDNTNNFFNASNLSIRYGALLWFYERYCKLVKNQNLVMTDCFEYFEKWPDVLYLELNQQVENAHLKQTKLLNHTSFEDVFGALLKGSAYLPTAELNKNFILKAIIEYFVNLVGNNPKSKEPNMADLLLNINEAAVLLCTSTEQVYRLYQDGYLKLASNLKLHVKLPAYQPAFYLRQVIELRIAKMQSQRDGQNKYVSAW